MTTTPDLPDGLEIKAYFASTVEAAMDQAMRELGPEALLLNSRQAPPEARHLGEYEVVFATTPAVRRPESRSESPAHEATDPAWGLVSRELRDLRRQVSQMREAMARGRDAQSAPELALAWEMLAAADVEPELAREIVEAARVRLTGSLAPREGAGQPPEEDQIRRCLAAELEGRFRVAAGLEPDGSQPRIVALVGPTGAGKTTTLVKLAVTYGLTARRPVQLLSMDSCRIAGAEPLRTYAAILGVGFQALETTRTLEQALAEHRSKSLILIDTPGFSPSTMEDAAELARWLSAHSEVDTHLVLPASMRQADVTRALDAFAAFGAAKLLFTRLDESSAWGSVFCAAARTGKPLSFLAHGQMIPEDLEPATRSRVVEGILRPAVRRTWAGA
jgi:flagellar biosynthesis protein FlhF